jgi:Flp pilus assembly protein TadG
MPARPTARARASRRGQVLVIFAGAALVFIGLSAVVVDIAWYWTSNLKIQRAADAAALAGAVYLDGSGSSTAALRARAKAFEEAAKNGYCDPSNTPCGTKNATIVAVTDPRNNRELDVTITTDVGMFFARALGITSLAASRLSQAEYVLPVPMGSPENYYGTFGQLRTPNGGTTVTDSHFITTNWLEPTVTGNPNQWSNPSRAYTQDDQWATETTDFEQQGYRGFPVQTLPAGGTFEQFHGFQVEIEGQANVAGCQIDVELTTSSQNQNWTSTNNLVDLNQGPAAPAAPNDAATIVPAVNNPPVVGNLWNRQASNWPNTLNVPNLGVRLMKVNPPGGTICSSSAQVSIDRVRIRYTYEYSTSTFTPDPMLEGPADSGGCTSAIACGEPIGDTLNVRGFWGTMLSPGSENIDGDAYLPRFDDNEGSSTNGSNQRQENKHYHYGIEIPSGSTGEVWIFDPVFCATSGQGSYGTGDRWLGDTGPVSASYRLYDTRETPFDLDDDNLVPGADSGTLFINKRGYDPTLNGPSNGTNCAKGQITNQADGFYYHNRWWRIATGLAGGATYRLWTASHDIRYNVDQDSDGQNSFAIWVRTTSGNPRVYGIGSMEAFTPLDPNTAAEFYLAQIDDVHAGKLMEIRLWDPGDTNGIAATLAICTPTTATTGGEDCASTGTRWAPTSLTWTSDSPIDNSNASDCDGDSGSGTSIVATTSNGTQNFNGCWLTILVPIPDDYSAPQDGWWKIRYQMGNQNQPNAYDLTTWEVRIRGNPVHLVKP